MIRNQLILDVNQELIVDNFAGGGGASTGIELALGRHVDHAINHDKFALGMHRINHPQTVHHPSDVFEIDPAVICAGRPVGLAHFSPDCKHFSKAKGGKPVDKRIRGLVLVMLRWAKYGARVMTMENVEEIRTWGPLKRVFKNGVWGEYPDPDHRGRTWKAFLSILNKGIDPDHPDLPEILSVLDGAVTKAECVRGFSYAYETREIRAYLQGTPTIRKRLYMIARCDGRPIVWPEATHAAPADRTGKQKPWLIIGDCIDWSLPCPSIFLTREEARKAKCKRPLAKATMRRVAMGIDRHVLRSKRPFLVSLTHQGGDRVESIDQPARTLTGAHRGEKALVCPVITEHANATNPRSWPADEPGRTQCAEVKGGHFAMVAGSLVGAGGRAAQSRPRGLDEPNHTSTAKADQCLAAATMVKLRGDPETHSPGSPATQPCDTISAGGQHHGVIAAYLAQHNGGFNETPGHEVTKPITAISSRGSQQQVIAASLSAYYGNDEEGQAPDEPARTVTTKERLSLVQSTIAESLTLEQLIGAQRVAAFLREHGVQFEGEFAMVGGHVMVDIGMRMLTPRELFRAQGFGDHYIIDRAWVVDPKTGEVVEIRLTKEQQIRMCGNSVCPQVMAALVRANVPEMAIWFGKESKEMAVA